MTLPPRWQGSKRDAERLLASAAKLHAGSSSGLAPRSLYVTLGKNGRLLMGELSPSELRAQQKAAALRRARNEARRRAEEIPQPTSQLVVPQPATDDPLEAALERARRRGAEQVAAILAGQEMLSSGAFAKLVGLSVPAVHDKARRHEVLGLEGIKRGVKFPDWQVNGNKLLPGLPAVFERLGNDAWTVYRFLVQHHPDLDGARGYEALRQGQVDRVLATADAIAGGSFS